MMTSLLQDIRFGLRLLKKNLGFTVVTVLILSLGIGMTTSLFSVVNASLLRSFPYFDPDRLVIVWEERNDVVTLGKSISSPNFVDCRKSIRTLQDMALVGGNSCTMRYTNLSVPVSILHVTSNVFSTLGIRPALGRIFTPEEDKEGNHRVAILTNSLWETYFQWDPNILGKSILLQEESYVIVGVMPPDFTSPVHPMFKPDILIPFGLVELNPFSLWEQSRLREYPRNTAIGRLRKNSTLQEVQTELDVIGRQLEETYPKDNHGYRLLASSLRTEYSHETSPLLYLLLGSSGLLLVIACANVANLLLIRGYQRRQEIAVRTALGAGRLRILRQLTIDGILLATLGMLGGLLFSGWGVDLLRSLLAAYIPVVGNIEIDRMVLVWTAIFALLAGIFFGLMPAIQTWKSDISTTLRGRSAYATTGIQVRRAYLLFIVSQIAMAFLLLAGSGLAIRTFSNLVRIDPGFNPRNVLTLKLDFPRVKYREAGWDILNEKLITQIRSLPGVFSVATSLGLPLLDQGNGFLFDLEDRPTPSSKGYESYSSWISPDYFCTLGIPLLFGRDFTEADMRNYEHQTVIINKALADQFWPSENPIGKRLIHAGREDSYEIIGVVKNECYRTDQLTGKLDISPRTFFPRYPAGYADLLIRTQTNPLNLASTVKAVIRELDEQIVIHSIHSMEDVVRENFTMQYLTMLFVSIYALFAFTLSSLGIYSVMAYSTRSRSKEIAIRITTGAEHRDILLMIGKQGARIVGLGMGIGLAGMFVLARFITSYVYGVAPLDFMTLVGAVLLLTGTSLLACYIPARRAAKVDPMIALRCE